MLNRVVLVGRITKDPEVKYTQNNIAVCNFTVAVNRKFTDNSGERQSDFINCIIWRKQAENMGKYVRKGNLLGVEGAITTRNYEKDGKTVYLTEVSADSVSFLETKGSGGSSSSNETHEEESTKEEELFSKNTDGYGGF